MLPCYLLLLPYNPERDPSSPLTPVNRRTGTWLRVLSLTDVQPHGFIIPSESDELCESETRSHDARLQKQGQLCVYKGRRGEGFEGSTQWQNRKTAKLALRVTVSNTRP